MITAIAAPGIPATPTRIKDATEAALSSASARSIDDNIDDSPALKPAIVDDDDDDDDDGLVVADVVDDDDDVVFLGLVVVAAGFAGVVESQQSE